MTINKQDFLKGHGIMDHSEQKFSAIKKQLDISECGIEKSISSK